MHGCSGACVAAGGHAWLQGGVRGCQGPCVVAGGCAWLPGACMAVGEGVCGCRGHVVAGGAWLWGACMVAIRACVGYDEICSMSGRYAFYWNAFLF